MKQLILIMLLLASPAWSQAGGPRTAVARVDNCAPIGRTADGKFVYSMKCEDLPAPPAPPPQAEARETPAQTPAQEPETQRSGLFGWSYDRRQ